MTYDERRVVEPTDAGAPPPGPRQGDALVERRVVTTRPTAATIASRIVVVVFGVVQLLLGARILFLLLGAREENTVVAGVLALSQPFVAPFEGILGTDTIQAGASALDVAAVVALVAWTAIELLVLAVLRIGRSGDRV
jgi:hypothetical protein